MSYDENKISDLIDGGLIQEKQTMETLKESWDIFKSHTGSTETESMGKLLIGSDKYLIEKLQADKAELLEALKKSNEAIMDVDWSENEGAPHLQPIYEYNESLIQKHKQ